VDAGELIKTYTPLRGAVIKLLNAGICVANAFSKWAMEANNGVIKGSLYLRINLDKDYSDILHAALPEGFCGKSEAEKLFESLPGEVVDGDGVCYADCIQYAVECNEPENIRRIEQKAIQTLENWLTDDWVHAIYAMLTFLKRV